MEKKKGVLIGCILTIILFLALLIAGCSSSEPEQKQEFQVISGQMEGNTIGVIFLPNQELCQGLEKSAADAQEVCVRRQLAQVLNSGYNVTKINTVYRYGYLARAEVYYQYRQ